MNASSNHLATLFMGAISSFFVPVEVAADSQFTPPVSAAESAALRAESQSIFAEYISRQEVMTCPAMALDLNNPIHRHYILQRLERFELEPSTLERIRHQIESTRRMDTAPTSDFDERETCTLISLVHKSGANDDENPANSYLPAPSPEPLTELLQEETGPPEPPTPPEPPLMTAKAISTRRGGTDHTLLSTTLHTFSDTQPLNHSIPPGETYEVVKSECESRTVPSCDDCTFEASCIEQPPGIGTDNLIRVPAAKGLSAISESLSIERVEDRIYASVLYNFASSKGRLLLKAPGLPDLNGSAFLDGADPPASDTMPFPMCFEPRELQEEWDAFPTPQSNEHDMNPFSERHIVRYCPNPGIPDCDVIVRDNESRDTFSLKTQYALQLPRGYKIDKTQGINGIHPVFSHAALAMSHNAGGACYARDFLHFGDPDFGDGEETKTEEQLIQVTRWLDYHTRCRERDERVINGLSLVVYATPSNAASELPDLLIGESVRPTQRMWFVEMNEDLSCEQLSDPSPTPSAQP